MPIDKSKAAIAKIGTSQRQSVIDKNTLDIPGPGNYNVESKIDGPAFKMGSKTSPRLSENPGPGSYDPQPSPTKASSATYKMGSSQR